jgi:CubicO group peptidase (beta-lactamase class C family)
MKLLVILSSFCLLVHFASAQNRRKPVPSDPFSGLDSTFSRVLKDWHAAGFAVAVVEKNKMIYSRGFGYRDYEKMIPVTAHTLFAIGSCTKAFTASLIGQLAQDGKVNIDKPVRDYLPALKFYSETMNNTITLRDMMCHRTGLPRHDFSWYLFSTPSRDSLLQRIQYMEPSAGIREKWQYNNFMFFAQGVLVEKLSGKSWEDNVKEKIFQPAGMKESVFSISDMERNGDASLGYGLKKDSIIKKLEYYNINAMGPAGSINSNVTDMANWVITWINGGKYNGTQILPDSYVNEAMSGQMAVGGGTPSKESPDIYFSNYGFGWEMASYRGHYRVEHGGNIDGFSASTCFFPSDSIGIIVLSNQNASTVPSIIRNILADRLLHLEKKDWSTYLKGIVDKARLTGKEAQKNKITNPKPDTHPSHPAADYTGLFGNPGYGTFEISLLGDSLFASFPNQTWWLRHSLYDIFESFDKDPKEGIDTSDGGVKLQFNMDQAGNISNISIDAEPSLGKPIIFTRTHNAIAVSKESLQKYTGQYSLGPNAILKIYIKDEKTLWLSVPGQPEYELVPIEPNKFAIKILTGFIVQFNSNPQGEITELLSIQPNGTFKATRKN